MDFFSSKNRLFISLVLVFITAISGAYAEEAEPVQLEAVFELDTPEQSPVAFHSIEQMDELVSLGLPALALRLLVNEQKNLPPYSPDWFNLEHKRISLLWLLEDWQAVVDSTTLVLKEAIPGEQISTQISQWFETQQIMANLRLGQAEKALSQLRHLLWSSPQPQAKTKADSDMIALWRRLIIRSYLSLNTDTDAQKALLRYQHDYGDNHQNLNEDWRLLQARSLLRTERAEEVITLLADNKSHLMQALRLLAAVSARPDSAELYAQEAQSHIENSKMNTGEMWAYHYVVYRSLIVQKKLAEASQTLKYLLIHANGHLALGEEFSLSGDELWQLYETIGQQKGNSLNLLMGDDLAWYNKASDLQPKNTVEALGLYVMLAFNASDVSKQQMAHKEIVDVLSKEKNGLELINQMYLHGSKISLLESLPLEVRYSLIDYALSKSDMKLAVRLMKSVEQAPQGLELFDWEMRKARVMILEGTYADGEVVLANSINNAQQITVEQLDQFLQVIFDLQAVGRHPQVLTLFETLPPDWFDDNIHRELFFWKAESYSSLQEYERAAWSYLKSAQLADSAQSFLWAQSSRFKAAGVLVKAALYDDAQTIYLRLLQVTSSASRKSAIKQELQQIRLLRHAGKSN